MIPLVIPILARDMLTAWYLGLGLSTGGGPRLNGVGRPLYFGRLSFVIRNSFYVASAHGFRLEVIDPCFELDPPNLELEKRMHERSVGRKTDGEIGVENAPRNDLQVLEKTTP